MKKKKFINEQHIAFKKKVILFETFLDFIEFQIICQLVILFIGFLFFFPIIYVNKTREKYISNIIICIYTNKI